MSRTRYKIYEDAFPHFMTCTIVGWLPVFTRPEAADVIYNSWRHLQKQRSFLLFGYVILENHLHLVASAPQLSEVMQSFKSYS
jgi:putative transposase